MAGAVPNHLESATLDFKREGRSRDDFLADLASDSICFANAGGGVLIVGVDDKQAGSTAFAGTDLDADVVRRRIYELSEPALFVEVEVQEFSGKRLLAVFVPQGIEIHTDKKGRARRRWGKDCMPMGPTDMTRLSEERRGFDWSAQPCGRSLSPRGGSPEPCHPDR
jgi:ATP-dependent DNA helicase RecG